MSVKVPFTLDGQVLKLVLCAATYDVGPTHPRFNEIKREMLAGKGENELLALVKESAPPTVDSVLREFSKGKVAVVGKDVTYDGMVVHNALTDFILRLQDEGLPLDGAVRFMERLYTNVSHRVREQLFNFMQTCGGFVITDDGCFLAYKAVRADYFDKYKGIFKNEPGAIIKMDRKDVDDDYKRGCSRGLHAGSLDYVAIYGHGDDRIVIVKISPEDVVSVPEDHSWKKIRTCQYTVIGDYEGALKKGCYSADKPVHEMYEEDREESDHWSEFDEYDEDDEDEYDEDEYDEDDDWDEEDSDVLNEEDDEYEAGQITVGRDERYVRPSSGTDLGNKPSGQKFWNRRDANGRFTKRS